jgi:hypothetical protein
MSREVGQPGTLGMIVASAGVPYLISARHVLAKNRPGIGDAICQPAGAKAIAIVDRVSAQLDCARARLVDGEVFTKLEILHIGILTTPRDPVEGIIVIKTGAATGVTQGKVSRIPGSLPGSQAQPPITPLNPIASNLAPQFRFVIVSEASPQASKPLAFLRIGGGHPAAHAFASPANRGGPPRVPQIVWYLGTRPARLKQSHPL